MSERESTQSEKEAPRSLERPPKDSVQTQSNFLGGTGDDDETKAEATEEAVDETTSESAPEEDDKPKKKRSGRDRRIKRLIRDRDHAQTELENERERIRALEAQIEELKSSKARPPKPLLRNYDSEEEYAEAYAAWKSAGETKKSAPASKPKKAPAPDPMLIEFAEWLDDGEDMMGEAFLEARKKADTQDSHGRFPLDKETAEYVLDSDNGHAIFIRLSKNARLARKVARAQGEEKMELLSELEEDIVGKPPVGSEKTAAPKKKTKAPPPGPRQERGGATGGVKSSHDLASQIINPDGSMSGSAMDELMRLRREEHQKRYRRQ